MTADSSNVAQAAAAVQAALAAAAGMYGPNSAASAVIGEGSNVSEPAGLEGGQPGDPVPKPQY